MACSLCLELLGTAKCDYGQSSSCSHGVYHGAPGCLRRVELMNQPNFCETCRTKTHLGRHGGQTRARKLCIVQKLGWTPTCPIRTQPQANTVCKQLPTFGPTCLMFHPGMEQVATHFGPCGIAFRWLTFTSAAKKSPQLMSK